MTELETAQAQLRLECWRKSPVTWDPVKGGRRPLVCWEDDKTFDLGADPDGTRFSAVSDRMLRGRYYPPDVLEFYGDWVDEGRMLETGDRVVQRARFLGPWRSPCLWAMVEIFVAERTDGSCTIGYVTTTRHFGRGIWRAQLTRTDGRLSLNVRSTAGPGSFLFWVGLPFARALMLRARRRAVEEFRRTPGTTVPLNTVN